MLNEGLPLSEMIQSTQEKERAELSVCLKKGDPLLEAIKYLCINSDCTFEDVTAPENPLAVVGATQMNTQELSDIVVGLLGRGIAIERSFAEETPHLSKLVVCALPVQDGHTVVNIRNWKDRKFLAIPVLESLTPPDFRLAVEMSILTPSMGDLTSIASQRALSEEASTIAGYMGGYPIGVVGGGKDLGIVVRYHPSPIVTLEEFALRTNGQIIQLEDFVTVASLHNATPDGWSASILKMLDSKPS